MELGGDPAALHLFGLEHRGQDLAATLLADRKRPLGEDAVGHVEEQTADLFDLVDRKRTGNIVSR
ncbi:MAG TPA: hypothetical protein VJN72_13720 [Gaiellales bacterium]|nr:hypothetical protein [Gaiellales bacterium]